MAILRKQHNPYVSSLPVSMGTKTRWDAINANGNDDFVAVKEAIGWKAGIAKKVPQTGMLGTRYDGKVEDTANAGNYITLQGTDGDVVEFRNVASKSLAEVGTGVFAVGSVVYGEVSGTTGKVTITSFAEDGDIVLGVVTKGLETWTDEDGSSTNKAVSVQLATIGTIYKEVDNSNLAYITSYSLPVGASGAAVAGVIDHDAGTIAVAAVAGTTVTSLAATFALSAGASAKIGTTAQTSGSTTNNFTTAKTYTVYAGDGIHTKQYVVTVTVAKE